MGRSYRAARREALRQPVTFDVERVVHDLDADGNDVERVVTDTFTCRGDIGAELLSEFAYASESEASSPEGAALISTLLRAAFGDDKEHARWVKYSSRHVDDELLMDIIAGLVEDFTGRPTQAPSVSPASPSTTGPRSKGASSPQDVAARAVEQGWVTQGSSA